MTITRAVCALRALAPACTHCPFRASRAVSHATTRFGSPTVSSNCRRRYRVDHALQRSVSRTLTALQGGSARCWDVYNDTDTGAHSLARSDDSERGRWRRGGGTPFIAARACAASRSAAASAFASITRMLSRKRSEPRDLYGSSGPVYIEQRTMPYLRPRDLSCHEEFEPTLAAVAIWLWIFLSAIHSRNAADGNRADAQQSTGARLRSGLRSDLSINGRCLGTETHSSQTRRACVFHVLNASAGEIRSLALPGHTFRIMALDGNPYRRPPRCPYSGWVLPNASPLRRNESSRRVGDGDLDDDDRRRGMGIVVEYADQKRQAAVGQAEALSLGLRAFRQVKWLPNTPDETIEITIEKNNAALDGFNQWTANGAAFSMPGMKPCIRSIKVAAIG